MSNEIEALDEIENYFDERSDADHNGVSFIPNDEMRMLAHVAEIPELNTGLNELPQIAHEYDRRILAERAD